ncbi:hypothetical protein QR680_003217 [Steinernema hermaphroditum]|uniref:Uncharacterized protein n=1 Tax=Steinernema hermaphroditum TaxID=289476 RepID=A0AA39H610_9BILA|nr:hypothetical protein QR680_003217 [Steinernema hermaphroditum]
MTVTLQPATDRAKRQTFKNNTSAAAIRYETVASEDDDGDQIAKTSPANASSELCGGRCRSNKGVFTSRSGDHDHITEPAEQPMTTSSNHTRTTSTIIAIDSVMAMMGHRSCAAVANAHSSRGGHKSPPSANLSSPPICTARLDR